MKMKRPDENDMAKAFNTISDAEQFLNMVVFIGSKKISEGAPASCPICGCAKDYGHSAKCELHRMVSEASALGTSLGSARSMFGRMEGILMELEPEED